MSSKDQGSVVVTGLGIVSCIGNNQDEVVQSLKDGKSGISFSEKYAEVGFRSHVEGRPNIDIASLVDIQTQLSPSR